MMINKLAKLLAGMKEEDEGMEESRSEDKEERHMGNKKGALHEMMREFAEKLMDEEAEEEGVEGETERNQAMSDYEAEGAEVTDGKVKMPKEKFKEEHTKLVSKLRKQDPEELEDEADEQEKELEDVEEKKPKKGGVAIVMALKNLAGKGE